MKYVFSIIICLVLGSTYWKVIEVVGYHDYDWEAMHPYWGNLLSGWWKTMLISASALVLSSLIAALLTAGQLSPHWAYWPPRFLSRIFVEFVRGTPLLTQILIGYYLIAASLDWHDNFSIGVVILSCFSGAYLSEIFRGGIESIPKSQWTSARAIGLSEAQTYLYIVIPQAIRRVLPASAGQFANLVKDSSLLSIISVQEFTMKAKETNAITFATFEAYLPLIAGYLLLTLPISLFSRHLEERFRYEH